MGPLSIFTFHGGVSLLFLRVILGAILIAHGRSKLKDFKGTAAWMQSVGFKPGVLFAALAMVLEFFGGIALVIGLFVQVVAFFAALQFLTIVFWKAGSGQHLVGGYELDLIILGAAAALFFLGGGSYSIDRLFLGWV